MANTNTSARTKFAGLVTQKKRPKKGLLAFLITPLSMIFAQENVEFDLVTSKRLVAKAKDRNADPTLNGSETFQNKLFTPPLYSEMRPYNTDNFRKRVAGKDLYSDDEVRALMLDKTAEDVAGLSDKIDRAKILQFAHILQTGKIPFKTLKLSEKGVIPDLDYECPAGHFSTVSIQWNNTSTAKPLDDLETLSVTIQKAYGEAPDTVIMGTPAFQLFLATDQVKNQLDNRKVERGMIGKLVMGNEAPAGMEKDGLNYLGYYIINGKKVGLYSYVDFYIDPADDTTEKSYINDYSVVMMNSEAKMVCAYAGINKIIPVSPELADFLPDSRIIEVGTTTASQRYVRTFSDDKKEIVYIEVKEAPLVIPVDYNSFGCLTVKT